MGAAAELRLPGRATGAPTSSAGSLPMLPAGRLEVLFTSWRAKIQQKERCGNEKELGGAEENSLPSRQPFRVLTLRGVPSEALILARTARHPDQALDRDGRACFTSPRRARI